MPKEVPVLSRRDAIDLALDTFGGNAAELQILMACAEKPTAPSDLAARGVSLGRLAYFFRSLTEAGLLRQTRRKQVRGAIKTYHTATPRGRKIVKQLGLAEDGADASS